MSTRLHFLQAIAAAKAEGFNHYAASLRRLYEMEYPAPATTAQVQRQRQARKDSHSHDPWGIHPAHLQASASVQNNP